MDLETPAKPQVRFWKLIVVAICLSVFLFTLQAKLLPYEAPSSMAKAVSSAKLWDGDTRLEIQNAVDMSALAARPIVLQFGLTLAPPAGRFLPLATPAPVALLHLLQRRRFFRPPPAL